MRAPGAVALGSGRCEATVTPREQPGSPESKPRAAQLGWAGGQMDCAVAGMLGPTRLRVAMGTGGGCPALVGGGAGGWTVCGLGEGSEGACGVIASSPAAPPPAVRRLRLEAVAEHLPAMTSGSLGISFSSPSSLSSVSLDVTRGTNWTKGFFGHSLHTCTLLHSRFV